MMPTTRTENLVAAFCNSTPHRGGVQVEETKKAIIVTVYGEEALFYADPAIGMVNCETHDLCKALWLYVHELDPDKGFEFVIKSWDVEGIKRNYSYCCC